MASIDSEENFVFRWLEASGHRTKNPALTPAELLAKLNLSPVLTSAGWKMVSFDGAVTEETWDTAAAVT